MLEDILVVLAGCRAGADRMLAGAMPVPVRSVLRVVVVRVDGIYGTFSVVCTTILVCLLALQTKWHDHTVAHKASKNHREERKEWN